MADEPDAAQTETALDDAAQASALAEDSERRRRAIAGLAVLAIIALLILLLISRPAGQVSDAERADVLSAAPSTVVSWTAPPAAVTTVVIVPDVVGQPEDLGRAKLENSGLGSSAEWIAAGEPEGTIVQQFPNAGVEVDRGTVVQLKISVGLAGAAEAGGALVPDVLGLSTAEARSKLGARGWSYNVVHAPSTTTPGGLVFYQQPGAGTRAGSSRRVTVWVSDGTPSQGYPYARPEN